MTPAGGPVSEVLIPQGWPLWIGIRERDLSWADPIVGWLYDPELEQMTPVTYRGPVRELDGRDWWIEPTEERARFAVGPEADAIEEAAAHPGRRVSRPPRGGRS